MNAGDSRLSLSYTVVKSEVYYLEFLQAADLDKDDFITNDDCINDSKFSCSAY